MNAAENIKVLEKSLARVDTILRELATWHELMTGAVEELKIESEGKSAAKAPDDVLGVKEKLQDFVRGNPNGNKG